MRWAVAGSGSRAELVEIAAGAECAALTAKLDPGDARVGCRQREGLDQLVAHLGVECVQPLGPGQGDVQCAAVPLDPNPRPIVPIGARRVGGAPRREFGPRLQDRVGAGLGLVPGAGGTVSLTRRIGRRRTAWLAFSGSTVDARDRPFRGLVDQLEP